MQVLTILSAAKFNETSLQIFQYLVDAGHYVNQAVESEEEKSAWQSHFDLNFTLLKPEELDLRQHDCELVLGNQPIAPQLPRIEAKIFSNDKNNYYITLFKNNIYILLYHESSNFLPKVSEFLGNTLVELYIDALINYSRGYNYGEFHVSGKDLYPKLIELTEAKLALAQQFKSCTEEVEQFYLQDYLQLNRESEDMHYVELQGVSSLENLEQFVIAMQMQLNTNNPGVYIYDLVIENSTVRKFIQASPEINSSQLNSKICNPLFSMQSNPFYDVCYLYEGVEQSSIGIIVDGRSEECYSILIQYNQESQTANISYKNDSPYFQHIEDYWQGYLSHYSRFINDDCNFREVVSLPTSLVKRYYLNTQDFVAQSSTVIKPIPTCIEEQAALFPEMIAIITATRELSYDNLNKLANKLANYLCEKYEITRGDRVVIYSERNEYLLVSILATMKLACAYVPIDLNTPKIRIQHILDNAKPKLILTSRPVDFALPTLIVNDALYEKQLSLISANNLNINVQENDLAYVIYTSGTTGIPKGVAIEHRSFSNIAADISKRIELSRTDCLLAVTTVAFDISTLEIHMPLMYGASVVLVEQQDLLEIDSLLSLIERHKITVMQATPSLWQQVVGNLSGKTLPIKALCGGEALPCSLMQSLHKTVDKLWNVYGPTETTVWSTVYALGDDDLVPLIGKPIANTTCYVLDDDLNPVAPGVYGELFIGGLGLARCYWDAPELTDSLFIENPFHETVSAHTRLMYRTGDVVRYHVDGNLEYSRRKDTQIKLRGHRIELGEIESILNTNPNIQSSVAVIASSVMEITTGSDFIAAYYVSNNIINEEELFNTLKKNLPEYMLPTAIKHLAQMPLSLNGKIDRKALPKIDLISENDIVLPQNDLQHKLNRIWSDILNVDIKKIGIHSDFFSLGGNSITAIRIVNTVNATLNCDLKIKDIFTAKTISLLEALINSSKSAFIYHDYLIQQADEANQYEVFALNNVQQTYYFGRFNNFELSNVSTHVYSEFRFEKLDHTRLEQAYNKLILRHASLRSIFKNGLQKYQETVPYYKILLRNCTDEADFLSTRDLLSHKMYSPDSYPLFDIVVSHYDGNAYLHLSFDAIIIDMMSFGILFSEWMTLYRNPQVQLAALPITYRDYHFQYEKIRESDIYLKAEAYWLNKIDDYCLDLNLPLACQPAAIEKPYFKRITKTISSKIWQKLLQKCRDNNISPTVLILELYSRILCFWSGQVKISLNLTLFNRLPLHEIIDSVIGDFTVLELFDYQNTVECTILGKLQKTHNTLMRDIDNNLCDGVDVQRLLKQRRNLPNNKIIAPVVLTSVLGMHGKTSLFELPIDETYQGVEYSISQTSQVWLDHKAYEIDAGFVAEWDYVEQLFEESVIGKMHDSYCELIMAIAELDWQKSKFPVNHCPEADLNDINKTNATTVEYPSNTLPGLFTKQIQSNNLHSIAVTEAWHDKHYSYQYVYDTMCKLATLMFQSRKDKLIAVYSEKGVNQVIATLAVMQAGYAYLPLHVEWPYARCMEILEQASCQTVLISRSSYEKLQTEIKLSASIEWFVIEDCLEKSIEPMTNWPDVDPDAIAYVIFTSGSTGKPKGVTINHRGAVNTIEAVNKRFNISASDHILALSELSFDLSVYDIFGLLAVGGCIVFPKQTQSKSPKAWHQAVIDYGVTIWNTVPQLASLLVDEASSRQNSLNTLRVMLMSGDWIPTGLPSRIKSVASDCKVMSLGGATEGSIWSIWYEINTVDIKWNSVPYGTAMPNQSMHVLNKALEVCPIGVSGEIYIGGEGVAVSYWQQPELTAERFIEHPVYGRLYKTGDLGRWHQKNYIEFMGRNDFQVKINGYRVELEEIAAKITTLNGIQQAFVKVQKSAGRELLVAYLLPQKKQKSKEELANKNKLLLAQLGIESSEEAAYRLTLTLNENDFSARKSYRQYADKPLSRELVKSSYSHIVSELTSDDQDSDKCFKYIYIEELLSPLAAMQLPDKTLPKYQYPSAGHTYAVQTYVNLNESDEKYNSGYYYFNPVTQALYTVKQGMLKQDCADEACIDLVVKWQAIIEHYGEDSYSLAYKEAGHMLALLITVLKKLRIPFSIEMFDAENKAPHELICRLHFNQKHNNNELAYLNLQPELYSQELPEKFINSENNAQLSIAEMDVFEQTQGNYRILRQSQIWFVLRGEANHANYLASGVIMQNFGIHLYLADVGSCAIGYLPKQDAIYTMALGYMRLQDKKQFEVKSSESTLKSVLDGKLQHYLPNYMMPHHYEMLDELPLTANGKLNTNLLPEISCEERYTGPSNETEEAICVIWADVLNRQINEISCDKSFFSLGGNSLLAMKLVRKLSLNFDVDFTLQDIYTKDTVIKFAKEVACKTNNRETGLL